MAKTLDCSNCGSNVTVYPSEIKRYDNHFCDNSCKKEFESDSMSGDGHWRSGEGNYEKCDTCENKFYRRPSRVSKVNFCNTRCEAEYIKVRQTGETNSNWSGGVGGQRYGSNWRKKRTEAIKRDDCECQVCEMSRDEHYKKYGKVLSVHHKIPIDTFDKPEDANYLINLVTTCMSCHGKLDTISRRGADRKPTISV